MHHQLAWEEWEAAWEAACSKLSGIVPYLIPDVCTDLFPSLKWVTTTIISPLLSRFDLIQSIGGEVGSSFVS